MTGAGFQSSSPAQAVAAAVEARPKPNCLADRRAQVALLVAAVVASRLPFLGVGFGTDPDAWRVFNTSRRLLATGHYHPSRLVGYPVQEFVTALVVWGGPWAVDGMACIMSAVAAAAFALWLGRLGVKNAALLAFAFACVPIIYVNSTTAVDYVWALAFVLSAVVLATDQKPLAAGLCAGLAIGTRLSSGAMLLPLALLLAAKEPSWRRRARAVARLALVALGVGALCYVPTVLAVGFGFPTDAVARTNALQRATLEVWGFFGCAALVVAALAAVLARGRNPSALPERERLWVSAACVAAIVIYALAFTRAPLEPGYLVPLVPFVIALAALWISNRASLGFAALLCVSPFVGSTRDVFYGPGPILEDHEQRAGQVRKITRIIASSRKLPPGSTVVAGTRRPQIEAYLPTDSPENERFIGILDNDAEFRKLRQQGSVYVVDRATEGYQQRMTGVRLYALGARLLPPYTQARLGVSKQENNQ